MATLTYKLRKTTGKGASIQLHFNYGTNKRLRYSTGLKISNIKNWNSTKMRVKDVIEELDKHLVNGKLQHGETELLKRYNDLTIRENVIVTNEILKALCDEIYKNKEVFEEVGKHLELIPFFEWFLKNYNEKPLPTTGKPLGKGTARTYRNTLTKLKKFSDECYPLTYEKITLEFYNDFLTWLYESNYSTNYIGTIIKILKTLMGAAFELGYHSNMDYNKRYFAKPTEEVYNIYLSQEELDKLYELDLTNTPTVWTNTGLPMNSQFLRNARDLFLIGANTGLRVSDFNRLSKKNIREANGEAYIEIITKKNSKLIAIPINWMVKDILAGNEGIPPYRMPDQHINYAMKHLGKLAAIDNDEIKEVTRGGKKVTETYKKYEMICNHTARRSFCTNAYLSEMPAIDIMAISGHSTEKVFYNYIKISHLDRAKKIRKNKFFSDTKEKSQE